MPLYFSGQRIRRAIESAGNSRAKIGLLDFLVVKRTFAIKGQTSVAITQSEPSYMRALDELAACEAIAGAASSAQAPYLNIFAIADTRQGYRSAKYSSNGTNSTISNNSWQPVIELTTDAPRRAKLRAGYIEHLEKLLLKSDKSAPKPNIDDVAIWYFRSADLSPMVVGATVAADRLALVRTKFIDAIGLTPDEIGRLFDATAASISDDNFVLEVSEPRSYLPGQQAATPTAPGDVTGVCSLDLVVALAAKPFVILTGPSGTGKSRAALKLAEGLQMAYGSSLQGTIFQLVPVGPDWTSPKKLIGFRSPFGETRQREDGSETNDSYEITETLRLLLRALHPDATGIPHFLILDEMNLSHVERYFAPFLSLMEAANILEEEDAAPLVDPQSLATICELLQHENPSSPEAQSAKLLVDNGHNLRLPPNLFVVGTVNVDETTYMFSPKVLDRAHVIEMEAQRPSAYLIGNNSSDKGGVIEIARARYLLEANIDDREGQLYEVPNPATILDRLVDEVGLAAEDIEAIRGAVIRALDGCYSLLSPVGFPFGYRTAKEVFTYLYAWIKAARAAKMEVPNLLQIWPTALDKAVLQKVLPKLHGNRRLLGESLKALSAFLSGGHANTEPAARYRLGVNLTVEVPAAAAIALPGNGSLTASSSKLDAMHARMVATGYVSFVS